MTIKTLFHLSPCRLLFAMLLAVGMFPIPLEAQKQKTAKTNKPTTAEKAVRNKSNDTTTDVKKQDAAALIDAYQFDAAAQLIERDIKAASRAGKSTALLEDDLRRARLGADMLRGTERVIIADSTVLSRTDFLSAYKLTRGCGTIAPLSRLVPQLAHKNVGQTAYLNDFGDRVVYAQPDSTGLLKLYAADKLGGQWGKPQQLHGMGSKEDFEDYPYMMADGVTLYFAAQGAESLGGYDIFVSRYNAATGEFVKAENLGMPFNSPANDYLMAIDETTGAGWFVTDRRQPADKVCVYCFIPSALREVYDLSSDSAEHVRSLARIDAIADSQTDKKAVEELLQRLKETEASGTDLDVSGSDLENSGSIARRYVINDACVYTSLSQFRNAAARRFATEADELRQQLATTQRQLEALRTANANNKTASETNNGREQTLQLEAKISELYQAINKKEKAMRHAELDE